MSPKEVTAIPPLPKPREWPRSSAEKVGTALEAQGPERGAPLAHQQLGRPAQGEGEAAPAPLQGLLGGEARHFRRVVVLAQVGEGNGAGGAGEVAFEEVSQGFVGKGAEAAR